MSEKKRAITFDTISISMNELFGIIDEMEPVERGEYVLKFCYNMITGKSFDDRFFNETRAMNEVYQSNKRKRREANNEASRKSKAKKAEKAEPAKPAKPMATLQKPAPPKPPKFNILEAVESFARSDEEEEVLIEFVKMRAEKKKPISRIAFNALAKKLGDLSVDDSVAAVRKSIENDWQGVFPESLKPRTFEREKSGAEKFIERVLREDLEEKNRQLKLKNEVKYELERS